MIIKNGTVYCEDLEFHKKDVYIENHKIISISDQCTIKDDKIVDATGLYVIPGLIDIHSHGAIGYDFSDANSDELLEILAFEKSKGITSYCPTSMTLSKKNVFQIFKTADKLISLNDEKYSKIVGFNMEGPFLDPKKKGAHDENFIIDPDVDFFRECNNYCHNMIKLVTLAPNMHNSISFIKALKDAVNISLGHTSADYETSKDAFLYGANHVTHLHNAMAPFNHREPGLIGAAYDSPDVYVEMICDGIHISPSVIRATFDMFKNRVVLISDSMRATGLNDGDYTLGGQKVKVSGKLATLEDGTIAGSVTCLFDMMKNVISFGVEPEAAIAAATINPAKSIGNNDRGLISANKEADLLLLDENWNLLQVI